MASESSGWQPLEQQHNPHPFQHLRSADDRIGLVGPGSLSMQNSAKQITDPRVTEFDNNFTSRRCRPVSVGQLLKEGNGRI
jgi:hypothetical protein